MKRIHLINSKYQICKHLYRRNNSVNLVGTTLKKIKNLTVYDQTSKRRLEDKTKYSNVQRAGIKKTPPHF